MVGVTPRTPEEFKRWIVEDLGLSEDTAKDILELERIPKEVLTTLKRIYKRESPNKEKSRQIDILWTATIMTLLYLILRNGIPEEGRLGVLELVRIALQKGVGNHNIMYGA